MKRRRCTICNKLTERWCSVNGSPVFCYDGCFSTTGIDNRTSNGKPLWEGNPRKADTDDEPVDEHGLTPSDYYTGITYPNG